MLHFNYISFAPGRLKGLFDANG